MKRLSSQQPISTSYSLFSVAKLGVSFHTVAELQERRLTKYSNILPHPYYRGKIALQLRSQQVSTLFAAWFRTACVVLDQSVTSCALFLYAPCGDKSILANLML